MVTDQLYLVRHGETEWSANGKHTGLTDLPLTRRGEDAARVLRDRLAEISFTEVITSPLKRARNTAALAGFENAALEPDLMEWNYGDYEGVTTPEIRETVPDWTVWTHPSPGGESADDVATRLDRVVARVRAADGPVLAFGHGHAMRALAARWVGLSVDHGQYWTLDTATVSVLGDDRGTRVIHRWNA